MRKIVSTLWRHDDVQLAHNIATEMLIVALEPNINFTSFDFARNHRRAAGSATLQSRYVHLSTLIYITVARTHCPSYNFRFVTPSSTSVQKGGRYRSFRGSIDRSGNRALPSTQGSPASHDGAAATRRLHRLIPEAAMIALLINAWSHHGLHGRLQRRCTAPCDILGNSCTSCA